MFLCRTYELGALLFRKVIEYTRDLDSTRPVTFVTNQRADSDRAVRISYYITSTSTSTSTSIYFYYLLLLLFTSASTSIKRTMHIFNLTITAIAWKYV